MILTVHTFFAGHKKNQNFAVILFFFKKPQICKNSCIFMKRWPIGIWQLNISRYIQDWKPKLRILVMLPQVTVSMSIFFWSYMLPRFRDIEGSTCPNNNFDQCPQTKKSNQKLHFSNVRNLFTVRDNELIFSQGNSRHNILYIYANKHSM